ncbi:hypothetical protein HAX54_017650, partial [Datura stramonium]|nr:hypothetical protein [Datura stramonium]
SRSGLDTVPSSGQLESEEAYDRRRTADRPNHKTIPESSCCRAHFPRGRERDPTLTTLALKRESRHLTNFK